MCKFKTNPLPKCFGDFFEISSNVHSYSTRYASGGNYSLTCFKNAISQRSIHYVGPKLWNELPSDFKNYAKQNICTFTKHVKEYLHVNQH